jgi:hypothetical protein
LPLFGGTKRDSLLVKHFSKELMHRLISVEVAVFKLSLEETNFTIYQESSKKVYYQPIRLFALVNKEDMNMNDTDAGMDTTQTVNFAFLRDDLKDIEFVMEVGDIIKFDENYYEIDNMNSIQYWFGRNPDTLPITTEGRSNYQFGYNIAVKCTAHLTRLSQLNLVNVRSGVNNHTVTNTIPRNL